MDIQPESPNINSSVQPVDGVVPPSSAAEASVAAPSDPNAQSTTLTQDMEATGEHPAVLTGLEPVGTPQTPEIIATHNAMVEEKKDVQNQPPVTEQRRGLFGKVIGGALEGMGLKSKKPEVAAVATPPDHLIPTGNGTLQTPDVANLNGATADGASAPKFEAPTATTPENNYAGLSTPDATAAGVATGVPFQNSISSPENGGVVASSPAPAEVVASDAPSLGTSQPEVVPQPPVEPMAEAEESIAEPVAQVTTEDKPAEFTPSATAEPAQEESTLPDAPTTTPVESVADVTTTPVASVPAVEPVAETHVEEPEAPIQSADANDEAVHAGPGAVADGMQAPPDWSVDGTASHPDAPVVSGDAAVDGDALGKAMADGAAAAADKPPFTTEALNSSEEVGHDIPIETGSEPATTGEVADAAVATANTDVDPTAPVTAVPGGMSPTDPNASATGPGMVDGSSPLAAGLPQTPKLEIVPNSKEVNNVLAFPGEAQQSVSESAPATGLDSLGGTQATAGEAPSNVIAFPGASPLAPTGTDGQS